MIHFGAAATRHGSNVGNNANTCVPQGGTHVHHSVTAGTAFRNRASVPAWAATTAAAATATRTTTAATARTTATAAAARRAILGFVHAQCATAHRKAIQALNGAGSVGIAHFDKGKAARTTRFTVHDHIHGLNSPMLRKQSTHLALVSGKGQISNVDFRHIT